MTSVAGMILAAGFGRRLLPATKDTPKPLLWYFGVPLLKIQLRQLSNAGMTECLINTHYLGDKIKEAVEAFEGPPSITLSPEKNILGTGGAFSRVHEWRKGRSLLVVNGDVIHLFPLNKLLEQHQNSGALATMGLIPSPLPGESAIWCTGKKVVGIGPTSPRKDAIAYGFACVQMLSDQFLKRIRDEKEESVIRYYQDALKRGDLVEGCLHECFWNDLGTPARYWEAHKNYLRVLQDLQGSNEFDPLEINHIREASGQGPVRWFLKDKTFFSGSEIFGPSAFGSLTEFGRGVTAGPEAVVMGPVTLEPGITIKNCLFHKSGPYTVACNITDLWESDSFVLGISRKTHTPP